MNTARDAPEQRSLLEEDADADLQALSDEIAHLTAPPGADATETQSPKRQPLPANLPRREIRHEPASTTCGCGCALKRIGEDVRGGRIRSAHRGLAHKQFDDHRLRSRCPGAGAVRPPA